MNIHSTSLRDLNLKYFRSGGCELKSTAIVLDILHSCYHSIHSYCMEVHFTICNDNEVFLLFFKITDSTGDEKRPKSRTKRTKSAYGSAMCFKRKRKLISCSSHGSFFCTNYSASGSM